MRHSRFHNASITRGILLFLAGVFLTAPGTAGAAKAPAAVSISAPMTGAAVQNVAFYDLPLIRGQLVYTFNTAVYAHGLQQPWDSYLVLRPFGKPDAEQAGQFRPSSVTSWKVNPIPYDYVYQPRLSPDGEYIAFQTSNLSGSFSSSDIHLYSPRTHRLQTIVTMVAQWPVLWSPDGRYLAYIGGDIPGLAGSAPGTPMELWVYELQTRQSRFLMRHDALIRQIAWTPDNQLLYSTVPDSGEMQEGKLASLYRVNPRSEKPAVYLLDDAIYPTPSPDGRWIAAFSLWDKRDKAFADKPRGARKAPPVHGLPPGKKALTRRRQRRLMVFPSAGGKPIRVSDTAIYDGSYLLWSPDGAHLYRLSKRYDSKEKATACIYDFTLATRQEREIATFEYATEGPDNNDAWPRIKTLCVSRDGRYLFYSHTQRLDGVYLKALDLQTHEILTVCRVHGDFDWLDESSPIASPANTGAMPADTTSGAPSHPGNGVILPKGDARTPHPVSSPAQPGRASRAKRQYRLRVLSAPRVRACAGAIADMAHKAIVRVKVTDARGAASGVILDVSYDTAGCNYTGHQAPSFLDGQGKRVAALRVTTNTDGKASFTALSSDVISKPRIVIREDHTELKRIPCDFAAVTSKRRFPDPGDPEDPNWKRNDTGWVCDTSQLTRLGDHTPARLYVKFMKDPRRGDVDGNWLPVKNHVVEIRIASITLSEDGSTVTDPDLIVDYLYLVDPKTGSHTASAMGTTQSNGAAQVTVYAGPNIMDLEEINFATVDKTQVAK